ncbi:hypothetical protein CAPTEDRAFT_189024, partial [Capitella teleta]
MDSLDREELRLFAEQDTANDHPKEHPVMPDCANKENNIDEGKGNENINCDEQGKPDDSNATQMKSSYKKKVPIKPVVSLTQEEYDEIFNSALLRVEDDSNEASDAQVAVSSDAFDALASVEIDQLCMQEEILPKENPTSSPKETNQDSGKNEPALVEQTEGAKPTKESSGGKKSSLKPDIEGLWVQCSRLCCLKWRFLPHNTDPAQIPEEWNCDLHPDEAYNSCEKAEQPYNDEAHKVDYIYTAYTEGSLVWAKMAGYPWWPAMVQNDPEAEIFFECTNQNNVANSYHVTFFDKTVSRSWVNVCNLKPFRNEKDIRDSPSASKRNKIAFALEMALKAQELCIEDRLIEFDFEKLFSSLRKNVAESPDTVEKIPKKKKVSKKEISKEIRKPSFVGPASKKRKISKEKNQNQDLDEKEEEKKREMKENQDLDEKKTEKKTPSQLSAESNKEKAPKNETKKTPPKKIAKQGTEKAKKESGKKRAEKPAFVRPSTKKQKSENDENDDILKETNEILKVTDDMLNQYFSSQEFLKDDPKDDEVKTDQSIDPPKQTKLSLKKSTPCKDSAKQTVENKKKLARPSFGAPVKKHTEALDQQVPQYPTTDAPACNIIGSLQIMEEIGIQKSQQPKKGFFAPVVKKSPSIHQDEMPCQAESSPQLFPAEEDSQSMELDLDVDFTAHL